MERERPTESTESTNAADGMNHAPPAVGAVSEDGNWRWNGTRWSIKQAEVTGSIIPRALAWTLVGAVPLGSALGLFLGPVVSRINSTAGVVAVIAGLIAAEAVVVRIVIRRTPLVSIAGDRVRVGRLGQHRIGHEFAVADVTSIELARGSRAQFMWTEGAIGEGKVLIRLRSHKPVELGWDAFSGNARRLAWLLGVPLVDSAEKAAKGKGG